MMIHGSNAGWARLVASLMASQKTVKQKTVIRTKKKKANARVCTPNRLWPWRAFEGARQVY
jgi:hypothetical protein